jgi:hypothetical protein
LLSFWNISIAQVSECGTKPGKVPLIFSKEKQDSVNAILAQSIPYSLRVFITVFANNDGSNRAASDADILRQFQNMVNQYQPQDICFSLINIKQVNNTDLNNQDADNEVIDLTPYMVSGCMNIFIHQTLFDSNGGLNGIAYAIPNTYLSLVGATVSSNSNLTTMGHELGHCLGLYHTFENYFGVENVTRNAASGCYNCNSAGDIICDTPADDPTNPNSNVDASCNYIGGRQDPCGVNYNPQTNNIMTYGNRACRNAFTNNQGTRMKTVLLITPSLNSLFSQDIAYVPSSVSSSILWNAGDSQQTARDHLILSNYAGDTYTVSGTAKHYIQSKKITMKPGTHFAPGAGGKVHVKVNPYCN